MVGGAEVLLNKSLTMESIPERVLTRSAAYLILQRENEILMLRRFNTGYKDGHYSFIAGHVEQNESVLETIMREAREEAGVIVTSKNLRFAHISHRHSDDGLVYYFTFW